MEKSMTSFWRSIIGLTKASLYLYHLLSIELMQDATKWALGPLSPK